jgi:hypothetical protein
MVTLKYANEVERRVNELLAQGNIEAAQLQAANIKGGGAGVKNTLNRVNTAVSAATDFRKKVEDSQRVTVDEDDDSDRLEADRLEADRQRKFYADEAERQRLFDAGQAQIQREWEERRAAALEEQRVNNVVTTLRGFMTEYGLGSLMTEIENLTRRGLNEDAVMAEIRNTDAYNQRFPAMRALRAKNRAISESAYIEFERAASGLERQFGLPAGMLGRDAISRLIENEVSERELEQRVVMAATAAYQVDSTVKNQFRDFYGIGEGGLAAYFLDPDRATPLLNKQFVSAQIGAEAARQDIQIGVGLAEDLQLMGVDTEQARQGFGRVVQQRGLTAGRGDVVSQQQLIQGNLMQNEEAQQAMERAAMSRRGRFEGGGSLQTTQTGVAGLGSSSGT